MRGIDGAAARRGKSGASWARARRGPAGRAGHDQAHVADAARHSIRFRANRLALASLVVLIMLLALADSANLLPLQSPTTHGLGADFVIDAAPSSSHWLGTDANGFDEFSRLIYGMRPAFAVGIIGQVITTMLGVALGVIAGYYGGWIDALLARLTDLIFAFPSFLLAFLVVSLFGPQFALIRGRRGHRAADHRRVRAGRLARADALRAQPDALASGAAVRGGGAHRGHARLEDHHSAYPAQHLGPGDGADAPSASAPISAPRRCSRCWAWACRSRTPISG